MIRIALALLALAGAAQAQPLYTPRSHLPLAGPPTSPPSRIPGSVFWQQINPGPVTVEESRTKEYQMLINKPPVR